MVNPITGPFTKVKYNNLDGSGSYYHYQYGFKQKRPYTTPLTYVSKHMRVGNAILRGTTTTFGGNANASTGKPVWAGVSPGSPWSQNDLINAKNHAVNSCRSKFIAQLNQKAMWAVSLIQQRRALEMIANRANQLRLALKHIRRGDITGAANVLGTISPKKGAPQKGGRGWRGALADPASLFLELHFGWEPLLNDIAAAVNVLQGPVPAGHVRVRGRVHTINFTTHQASNDVYKTILHGEWNGRVGASMGCDVYVTNPNLYLANQLGFVNPASIAWEVVPFSFVVDWFINVQDFLDQSTDLYGLQLVNPWTSWGAKVSSSGEFSWINPSTKVVNGYIIGAEGSWSERTPTISSVTLGIKPYSLSPVRALTAISLLVTTGLKPLSR